MSREAADFGKMPAIQRKLRDDYPPHGAVRPILLLLVGASGSGRTTFYETHLKTAFSTLLKGSASPLEQTEADQERKRLMKLVNLSFIRMWYSIHNSFARESLLASK